MLLDNQNLFSDAQKITAATASDRVVKMANPQSNITEVAYGTPIPLLIQIVEDFSNAEKVGVEVQSCADEAFETPKTLASAELEGDELKAGAKFPINYIPKGNLGYMRLYYTPTAQAGKAIDAGAITAGIIAGTDNSYQDM